MVQKNSNKLRLQKREKNQKDRQNNSERISSSEILKIKRDYHEHNQRKILFISLTTFGLIFFILLGMTLGAAELSLSDIFGAIFGNGEPSTELILWKIRLPRVLSAAMAGMALAVSGLTMQCILRNPLGSPFTLGISHAAAFGAAFAVVILGAGSMQSSYSDAVIINNPYIMTLSSFIFCLIATFSILFVSKLRGSNPHIMILMGIVLGSLFSAGSTALQYFADEVQLAAIVYWTFGDLGRADWLDFIIISCITIPSILFFYKNAWNYNVLDAGDDVAISLGLNVDRLRISSMIVSSLLTAVVISFFGIIAYVGLVVPHIVRKIIGSDERYLLIASALFGSLFLLVSDTIGRTIISPLILPVGVLTSFLGAPMFIFLLIRGERRFQN